MGIARAAHGQEDNLKLSYNFDYTMNWFAFSTLDSYMKFPQNLIWLKYLNFFPIIRESGKKNQTQNISDQILAKIEGFTVFTP